MKYFKLTTQHPMDLHSEEEVYRFPAETWQDSLQELKDELSLASCTVLNVYMYTTREELLSDLKWIYRKAKPSITWEAWVDQQPFE